jgi:hypothetical protein
VQKFGTAVYDYHLLANFMAVTHEIYDLLLPIPASNHSKYHSSNMLLSVKPADPRYEWPLQFVAATDFVEVANYEICGLQLLIATMS